MNPRQIVERNAAKFGVPFWLMWGIAGAESTWKKGGSNIFGLLDAAEGANISDWNSSSHQAAKTLAGLKKMYGSWSAAVDHYSGYSYTIAHPKKLAEEQGVVASGGIELDPFGQPKGLSSGGPQGLAEDAVEATVGAAGDVVDFVGDFVSTVLNFRKMGELMAKIMAWFIRLIARAIWDYCLAPLWHWNERAVVYYYENFFGEGTESGSGFGYIYRANAGVVTLMFWGLGYGLLWTGPDTGIKPVDNVRQSYLGRTVKGIEGAIKKRKVVKPSKVKEKTPPKPTPKPSTVTIEKTKQFSASRNRPVRVAALDAGVEIYKAHKEAEGRQSVSNQRGESATGGKSRARENGGSRGEEKKQIILPQGVKKPEKQSQKKSAKQS